MNKITKSILSSLSDEIENGLNVNFECRSGKISVVWHWEEKRDVEESDEEDLVGELVEDEDYNPRTRDIDTLSRKDTPITDSDIEVCENYNFQCKSCDSQYEPLIKAINSSLVNPPTNDDTLDDIHENDNLFPSWENLTDEEKKENLDIQMDVYWDNSRGAVMKKIKYMLSNIQKGYVRDVCSFFKVIFNLLNNSKHVDCFLNNDKFKAVLRQRIKDIINVGKMTKNLYEEVCQLYPKIDVPKQDVVLGRPYWNLFTTEQQKILTDE